MKNLLALALVIAGVAFRVVPHPWNFAPIGAIALFAGAHFTRKGAGLLVPLVTMFIGDSLLQLFTGHGYHSLMPAVYGTYALIAVIGICIRDRRRSLIAVAGGALSSSLLFFVITNFAMWTTSSIYARTFAGLVRCYVAAIPYFGNTLASDAIFTAILFGTYAAMERYVPESVPASR